MCRECGGDDDEEDDDDGKEKVSRNVSWRNGVGESKRGEFDEMKSGYRNSTSQATDKEDESTSPATDKEDESTSPATDKEDESTSPATDKEDESTSPATDKEDERDKIENISLVTYMQAMDAELGELSVEKKNEESEESNLISCMVTSVEAQLGMARPASNMIGSLGLKVPR